MSKKGCEPQRRLPESGVNFKFAVIGINSGLSVIIFPVIR